MTIRDNSAWHATKSCRRLAYDRNGSVYLVPEAMKSRDDSSLRLPLPLSLPLPLALRTSPPPSPEASTSTSPSPTPATASAASLLPPGLHPALLSAHTSFLGQMRQAALLGGLSPALLDYWGSLSAPSPAPHKRPINNNNNSVNNYNTVRTNVPQPSSPSSGSSPQSMGSDGCGAAVQLPSRSAPASSPAPSASAAADASRDKQFTCLVCQRSFGYKHVLQNHERTHTGEKPFECVECHKRFTRDHHLKTHMRLHTGEKPYHCEHCDRQFVQVANLRRHLRVHTGEKPYACELCDARFSDSNQLKAHVLIHKGEKPFACDRCRGRFRRRHHLEHHKCPGRTSASAAITAASVSPGVTVTPLRAAAATFKHRLIDWDGSSLMAPEQTEPEDLSVRRVPGSASSPPHSGADSSRSRSRSPSPASPSPTPPASDWSDDAESSYLDSLRHPHPKFRHVQHGPAS